MGYAVREAAPADVEADLVALWTANLHMGGDPRDKYRWFYLGNPLGAAQAFLVEASGPGDRAVVGTCGLGARTLLHDGRRWRAGLLADFALEPAHRTVMPGLILQRALAASARERFDFTYAFPNNAALGILSRIGYRLLGRTGRYVRPLRLDSFLRRYLGSRALARLAAAVPNALLAWTDRAKAAWLPRRLHIEWLAHPDPRFDVLWQRASGSHAFMGERTAAFLRWRFTERPGLPGELAALVDSETGAVRAYAAVVQKVQGVALLADFLADGDDALETLFRLLFPALRSRGFEQATTCFLGADRIDTLLRDVGFSYRNAAKNVVIDTNRAGPELLRRGDWYLTDADRDN
ncbi:MAG TPA: hypothetical protein VFQ51_05080 [Vicinamibacteria bacterium]|nr:hypothetical protein [Vicinamibacteria bacterium]